MEIAGLFMGLGNPGPSYANTRHNFGFMAADAMAEKYGIAVKKLKFQALYGEGEIAGNRVLLLKPQTFMNKSGESVREALSFYKLTPENLIVVYDDMSIPCGKMRIRQKGSDGGHNGIKNILYHLQTDEFLRIKLGVGKPPRRDYDQIDWVLGKPQGEEWDDLQKTVKLAGPACEEILKNGFMAAANIYNGI